MSEQLINGVATTLTTAITSTGQTTGIQVALKPRDAVSGRIRIVFPASLGGEIVTCTSLTGSGPYTVAGTVLRGQENTIAGTYPAGTAVEVGGLTAAAITQSIALDAVATAGNITTQQLNFGGGTLTGPVLFGSSVQLAVEDLGDLTLVLRKFGTTGEDGILLAINPDVGSSAFLTPLTVIGHFVVSSGTTSLDSGGITTDGSGGIQAGSLIAGVTNLGTDNASFDDDQITTSGSGDLELWVGNLTVLEGDAILGNNVTIGTLTTLGGGTGSIQSDANDTQFATISELPDGVTLDVQVTDNFGNNTDFGDLASEGDVEAMGGVNGVESFAVSFDGTTLTLVVASDNTGLSPTYTWSWTIGTWTSGSGGTVTAYNGFDIVLNGGAITLDSGTLLEDGSGGMDVAGFLSVGYGIGIVNDGLSFPDESFQTTAYPGLHNAQKVPIGTSGSNAQANGSMFERYTDLASAASAGTTQPLYNYTVPAGAFTNNGDKIRATFTLSVASNTRTKTVAIGFGAVANITVGTLTVSQAGIVVIDVILIRVSATVVRCTMYPTMPVALGTVTPTCQDVTGLTLTSTQSLIVYVTIGTGAVSGDITAKMDVIEFLPYSGN